MLEQRLKDYWESRRDSVHGRLEPCCFLIRNFYGASKQSQEEPEPTRGRDPGSLRKTRCWRWARKIKEQPGRGRGRKGVQEGQTPGPGGRDTMRLRLRLRCDATFTGKARQKSRWWTGPRPTSNRRRAERAADVEDDGESQGSKEAGSEARTKFRAPRSGTDGK